MLLGPHLLEAGDGRRRQTWRVLANERRQRFLEVPWLGELDDVTVGHGVSLLHWRSGGVEHHHDTPPYPVTPSPTSSHSSRQQQAPDIGQSVPVMGGIKRRRLFP